MRVLVTNDDGIHARGLWALVGALARVSEVVVVAPDREQSAVGTAVTLHQPLRVQNVRPEVPGIPTYAVAGTPSDSVVLAIGKLLKDKVDMVISGINHGPNVGNDVFISGTVGGAMIGYLHGLSAMAVSINAVESPYLDTAAHVVALLASGIVGGHISAPFFLNVNLPDLHPSDIKGVRITRMGSAGFADTVEEGHDGRRTYYWLVHKQANKDGHARSDIRALAQDYISITPLHANFGGRYPSAWLNKLCADLLREWQTAEKSV
ncbi:MAG: 5'/3'-nucleotidase SurE [Chloroflexi bacterium]|nr:5'/3'-nucleotidase SurE [Chloroflexota bacterium]